jgi:hypothetical protein
MIEKPKKERRFLKTLGKIGEILLQEVLLKVGSNLAKRIGGKKTLPSILFLFLSISLFAQYPANPNKQRLGYQTTGDGLVYRGRALDTMTIKSSGLNNAYFILDTVNNILYNYIKTKGGWKFSNGDTIIIQGVTMPFDSITFNTAKDGTVTVGEVEYNDTQGSLIQGLKGGLVTNVIGQQLHQRINNRTGSTLAKGTAVYLSGSQGNRITVAKALGVTDAFSANTFGIVAESIANNQSGYVITEGLITNINTSALVEDSAVYLSPTVAGGLTSTKPQAPQHTVYIGVCVKSNAGSGELFVKIRNGQELEELHDVRITSPVNNASLYYKSSEGIWRDTTPNLLVSDTASMLTNYLRSGVAASTYQPLLSGITNYLPKFTATSTLGNSSLFDNGNIGLGTSSPTSFFDIRKSSSDNNFTDTLLNLNYTFSGIPSLQNVTGLNLFVNTNQQNSYGIISETSTNALTAIGVKGKATQSDVTGIGVAYGVIGEAAASGSGTNGSTYAGYFNNTSTVGGNHYGLFVNTASGGDYGIYQTGTGINYFGSNSTFAGTLGVTGATTLTGALTVNNATVLNEGSGDFDTRIESDGNANMVFVDASTDRVGIGTGTPSKTLDINGEVKIATVTATPTSLLGKDGSNVVGEVTTVAQTGLMTRGETTATTGSPSAIFTVTHGLGSNPSAVIVTSAGIGGGDKIIFEVYTKSSTTFSVQAWNLDGTEASSKSVKIYWLAIK